MSNAESFADADADLNRAALEYHAKPVPGKTAVEIKKPAATQRDLSLAYTPG
ncbi:MAG: malate dehydrogenase, partial [Gammaproteobacteria bacterium]|nr:malate dehydrogenase [Gammaproteobacteria bacterium]